MERFDTTYTLRVQPSTKESGEKQPVTARDLQQAVFTLQKRLRPLKAKKTKVTPKGSDQIEVTVKQLTAPETKALRATLTTPAILELKLVHPDSRTLADKVAADPENKIVPGYELQVLHDTDEHDNATSENLLVKSRTSLDDSYIVYAQELYGPYEGQLDVELSNAGAEKMFQLTEEMQHGTDRLAIVLDDEVLSAPVVQSSLSKKFQISGLGNAEQAKQLALALLNPLKSRLVIEEEKRTSSHLLTDPSKKAAP